MQAVFRQTRTLDWRQRKLNKVSEILRQRQAVAMARAKHVSFHVVGSLRLRVTCPW